jgi:hypothetical protein
MYLMGLILPRLTFTVLKKTRLHSGDSLSLAVLFLYACHSHTANTFRLFIPNKALASPYTYRLFFRQEFIMQILGLYNMLKVLSSEMDPAESRLIQ